MILIIAYGGQDEIVDAVRALLTEQAERGLTVAATIPEITRNGIAAISTRLARLILIS